MGRQTQTDDATDELDDKPTRGDYLHGSSAIYKVTDRDGDSWRVELAARLSRSRRTATELRDAAGWKPATWVNCHTVVNGESVRSLTIETGDIIRWDSGTLDGEPARAAVTVEDDRSATLSSDAALIPESYDSVLALKCNIVGHNGIEFAPEVSD